MKAFINAFRGQQNQAPPTVRAVVVAKTHLKSFACVGALDVDSDKGLRLMQPDCRNQPGDTEFEVGQLWELECKPRPEARPPHVEDVLVFKKRLVGQEAGLREFLLQRAQPWQGHPKNTFEGLVRPTYEGSGYVNEIMGVPGMSTGFWQSDKPLTLIRNPEGKPYYEYPRTFDRRDPRRHEIHRLRYVGYASPVEHIPPGTLVRISLARWWKQEDSDIEERCYLQLSGWYL